MSRTGLLFAVMCAIWGATWVAVKAGVAAVPPAFFAGTRFAAAGALLALLLALRGGAGALRLARGDLPRLGAVSLLMIALTYPPLFWGAARVGSGLAAVIDLAFLPVALLGLGIALGEERWTARRAVAIGLGMAGLGLLFGRHILGAAGTREEAAGAVAILLSALAYALGSLLARPLLRRHRPEAVAAWSMLLGGAATLAGALVWEEGALAALDGRRWGGTAWAAWAFLLLGGSLVAYTIYLRLLRDWGPARAGAYAFVSPVIALALGAAVLGEQVGSWEASGSALMLVAAWLALREEHDPAPAECLPPRPARRTAACVSTRGA